MPQHNVEFHTISVIVVRYFKFVVPQKGRMRVCSIFPFQEQVVRCETDPGVGGIFD